MPLHGLTSIHFSSILYVGFGLQTADSLPDWRESGGVLNFYLLGFVSKGDRTYRADQFGPDPHPLAKDLVLMRVSRLAKFN